MAALLVVYALVLAIVAYRVVRSVPLVERLDPPAPSRWPRVSVVIPACNEEATIGGALASRLGEGYPDAEYVVVDDRSTDRTGEIARALAKEDPRLVVHRVESLPEGWLGKVHALHTGVTRATGEWILFSDADVHHEPGTLARIVAHAEASGLDHVAVVPTIASSTFALDVALNVFARIFVVGSRAWKLADPASRVSVGGGNFALVRRSALERAGGLAPLAMEVVDDAGLGQLLRASGARPALLNARGFVSLHFYRSLPEGIRGMEKNAFAVMGYDPLRAAIAVLGFAALEVGPLVAFALGHGWTRAFAGLALAILVGTQLAIGRWIGRPALPTLLAPLGALAVIVGMVRSAVLTVARGGVVWRGTRYPLALLRRRRCFALT